MYVKISFFKQFVNTAINNEQNDFIILFKRYFPTVNCVWINMIDIEEQALNIDYALTPRCILSNQVGCRLRKIENQGIFPKE